MMIFPLLAQPTLLQARDNCSVFSYYANMVEQFHCDQMKETLLYTKLFTINI